MLEFTKSYKIVFSKGEDKVTIQHNLVEVQFKVNIEQKEKAFYGYIPAFKAHFYTATKEEIEACAASVVESFFNFWKKTKPLEEFIQKMVDLGFSVNLKVKPPTKKSNIQKALKENNNYSFNLNKNLTLHEYKSTMPH